MVSSRSYKQKAVLWAYSSTDETGDPVVSAAAEISCRWEHRKSQIVGPEGKPVAVDAEVWVTSEIALDSILWKGELTDLPNPVENVDLYVVVAYNEIPDLWDRTRERTVLLARYGQSLPTVS